MMDNRFSEMRIWFNEKNLINNNLNKSHVKLNTNGWCGMEKDITIEGLVRKCFVANWIFSH